MDELSSSHAIIKALKGPEEHLTTEGLSKVEIARKAWESTNVHFLNKDEVLVEWILSSFSKHNKSPGEHNKKGFVLSTAHWSLLSDILSTNSPSPSSQHSRQIKVWLVPLLNRISILNIATSFFKCACDADLGYKDLTAAFTRCMSILWPLAANRMNLDALTECLGAVLEYVSSDITQFNSLASALLLVVRSFRQAVGNTSSKKKAFSWFMQQSFLHWVDVVCIESSGPVALERDAKIFKSEMYQAGIEVFFCLDSLKSTNDPLVAILADPKHSPVKSQRSGLQIVPMLYKSYVQEMRKHRLAVFGSGSNQTQEQTAQNKFRDAGMRAFSACYRALLECRDTLNVWKDVLTLVEELHEANLVGFGLSEKTDILNEIAASAVDVLTEQGDDHVDKSETALQVLCVLSHINFDLIVPLLARILSALRIMNPLVYPSSQNLLREILEFHSKTRTIPSYMALLLESLSKNEQVMSRYSDVREVHRDCTSGSLLCLAHLEDLSHSIRSFLTLGQTEQTVNSVLSLLRNIWSEYAGKHSLGADGMDMDVPMDDSVDASNSRNQDPRKSGSVQLSVSSLISSRDRSALAYSLVARAVAVIVPSLRFSSLSEAACASIRADISNAWTDIFSKGAEAVFHASESPDSRWDAQCISTATLRIRHAFLMCPALHNVEELRSPIAALSKTTELVLSTETIPELVIELVRAFFDSEFRSASSSERDTILNAFFTYLDTHLRLDVGNKMVSQTVEVWDASSSSLGLLEPGSHERGALAMWHLLLYRWLPILDEIASLEQLKRLSQICLTRVHFCSGKQLQLSFTWTLERAIRSAAFWEMTNLRDALISEMDSSTQCANWEHMLELLKQVQQSSKSGKSRKLSSTSLLITWQEQQVHSVLATFSMLLRAPREYLPRHARLTFVRRALVANLAVSIYDRDATGDATNPGRRTITIIRGWLVSMSDVFDIVDIIPDDLTTYIEYLMRPSEGTGSVDADFVTVTLELLSIVFRQIIRSAVHGKGAKLEKLCAVFCNPPSSLSEQSLLRFIGLLVTEFPNVDKLPLTCVEAVKELYSNIHARYLNALSTVSPSVVNITNEQALIVRSWRTCLLLRKWLNTTEATPSYSIQILRDIMTSRHDSSTQSAEVKSLCTETLLLLLEELSTVPVDEKEQHLAIAVSAYVLLLGRMKLADQDTCDRALGRMVRSLPTNEFSAVLSLLREALAKGLSTSGEVQAAVHLSSVFLGDAPEGTMQITQAYLQECLHIFCAESKFVNGDVDLNMEVLDFIGKMCSEKPASLRHLALGPIWLLLSKFLAGSNTHARESHTRILHSITSIASSLVRLRRDLVTSALPHLGLVLRLLIRALCAPRGQLGARQRAQVSDTLPWWVSPSAPLGVPEARAVARLLTSLQAKTVPRTFTSREHAHTKEKGHGRTAESLLIAFSKHAAPVLGAYISVLVDPLIVLDAGMREALAPGLYTLCEAMGEHQRDALMASGCDAAGRTVLKALWRAYEKQRYVGKG